MNYDIIKLDKWKVPKKNGAPLLCMPNIPLPLHSLAPRTIMGEYRWSKVRKKAYMDQEYTCAISGAELGHGKCHLHELYSIDWANQTSTFERYVVLDPRLHTRFVHSGKALTMFERKDPIMPKSAMLTTLERGFSLIADYNMKHYDEEPLRVCSTLLSWAENPELGVRVQELIKKYHIKFYDFDKSCFNKKNWGKWKLIYDGKEYPTQFPTQHDWEEHFAPPISQEQPRENKTLSDLDELLKEELKGRN